MVRNQLEALADGLSCECSLCEGLVHNRNLRRARLIAREEIAAGEERHAECLEVILIDHVAEDGQALLTLRQFEAFRSEAQCDPIGCKRKTAAKRGGLDAGQLPGFLNQRSIELFRLRKRVAGNFGIEADDQPVIESEAGIRSQYSLRALVHL